MYNNRKVNHCPKFYMQSYLLFIKSPTFLKGKWGHGNNKGELSVFLLHILSV